MIQGRQQQTAMPMTNANATQNTTKSTSNAKNTKHSLQSKQQIINYNQSIPQIYSQCMSKEISEIAEK